MVYLVDTNVLLRLVDRSHPLNRIVRNAFRKLRTDGHELRVMPQNIIEFWNVVTRPSKQNGLGLSPIEADQITGFIEKLFPLLSDLPTIYHQWRKLAVKYGVSGVQVHDARLAAGMLSHRIEYILTFNVSDFTRFEPEGIVAVDPESI